MLTLRNSLLAAMGVVAVSAVAVRAASRNNPGTERMSATARDATAQDAENLIKTLKKSDNYKTLAQLLELAGLAPTLQGSAQFTVFAPTDAAFGELPAGKLDELKRDTAALKKVLLYHVVNSAIPANQVLKLKTARTMQGPRVEFMMKDGQLQVNGAAVLQPDIKASNGVIHGITKVLMPK